MKLNIAELGPRIAIIGGSCSGKSTLASELLLRVKLPVCHLDRLKWMPGQNNIRRPDAEYKADLQDWVGRDSWIIEGCYLDALPYLVARATGIIELRPSRWVCLWRYFRRLVIGQKGICDGDVARFDWGMVRWILWDYPQDKQPQISNAIRAHPHVITLR